MPTTTYHAQVNEEQEFALATEKNDLDVLDLGNNEYHIITHQQAFHARVLQQNGRTFAIQINGNTYDIQLKDEFDQLVDQLGLSVVKDQMINDITAPMPGLVLSIETKVGDTVEKGDALLILEAMKMENVLKSPGTGTVKSIEVTQGAAVEKGALLVVLE
ncbi:MAG: acetyl-CoA carboxylase biotin carboxyl carrier protein subunit [Saprospiraceae bacterium]